LSGECPGLLAVDQPDNHVLALRGLAAPGRSDPAALSGQWLVGVDHVGERVEARFAPAEWGGIQVRARWCLEPTGNGIDLEVEALASSVGELKRVEVFVTTRLRDPGIPSSELRRLRVHPRDSRSASLSYDGREAVSDLARLTTEPLPASMEPEFWQCAVFGPSVLDGDRYLELAHPDDVARRIVEGDHQIGPITRPGLSIRYGLFGHDLEKGVIVRGRLRGLWISRSDADDLPHRAVRAFLETPPPLGP
jgi:hypothetical protein